tara:strand:+ start:213 stop:1553 length:1341 start_codon:yes stop_codon:yes gene_type:complete
LLDALSALVIESKSDDPAVADVKDRPANTADKSAPILTNVYFYGDDSSDTGDLSRRLTDFGIQLIQTEPGAEPAHDVDVITAVVDFDAEALVSSNAEVLRRISEQYPGAIAISADGSFEGRLAALRAGFETYLEKPLDVTTIVDAIDKRISERQPEPFRILIVDDDQELGKYVELILSAAGMISQSITNPFETFDAIREFCPELILLDLNMPECSGVELATIIRQQDALSSVSIAFLSSETEPARQIEAMHSGGDDFLPKTLRAEHLVSAVEARVKRFRQLRSMLVSDSLTGLLNHTATKHQIETEIGRAKRERSEFSLVMIDIDHFKAVNDTYGHGLGDEVIRSLALLLKQRFRTTDVIGRLGGEEFGLVLSGAGREDAVRIVDEVRQSFSEMEFQAGQQSFSVTFSAGISLYPAYQSVKDLSDAADRALYEAKHAGRNRVVVAD